MVFGTFDILHPGHLSFFRQAKQYGDYLIIVVAHDQTVKQVKGRWPLNNQLARIEKIFRRQIVDQIIAGQPGNKFAVILEHQPAVICLGYDQQYFVPELLSWIKKNNMKIIIKRAQPYQPAKYKSSRLRKSKPQL